MSVAANLEAAAAPSRPAEPAVPSTDRAAAPAAAFELPPSLAPRWQEMADILAEVAGARAALIRVAEPEHLAVLVASRSADNPYRPGSRLRRGGLYCEIALDLGRHIVLPDAGADGHLSRSAEREYGLPAYMGVPIARPDGAPFGTLAVFDAKPRGFDHACRRLLLLFRDTIQSDLAALAARDERQAEETLRGQARILEMIVAGAPLAVTLANLIGLIESQMPGSICSILLLDEDGQHIRHGAAPSLPKDYVRAVDGIRIGPKVGSCGTAMYWGKPVVVADIDSDPLWDDYRGLAVAHGLRACWSTPIMTSDGLVLGAFANYYRTVRTPSVADTHLIELAVHVAAIAIESKRVEAKLRANERRFRDYAETASDWFWETGPDYRLTFMSQGPGPDRHLGYNPIGKTSWELAADAEEDAGKWEAHRALLDKREPFRDLVFKWRNGERGFRYVAASGGPFFDADGRFAGYRGTARDVTEQVVANKTLLEAKQQAEVASKAKSEFLANMSHELRTPLNAIIGFADFIEQEPLGPLGNPRYREYVRDIARSGKHLLDIINDVLDVARIEAGKAELHEEEVALPALVEDVLKIMGRQIERARLQLARAFDPAPPRVRADARALRQILLNLVSNAVKFTPEGGTITIALARRPGAGMALSVSDTGIGIAAGDIPKLMQPFAQVDNVYRRKHQGAGLGLTLVRSFAEMHGGRVQIESAPGRGTTVTITLPESRVLA
jgi:signal transduction histidine kinase